MKETVSYFQMTLHDLAHQWISTETFVSVDDLRNKFVKEFSTYGKTPQEWLHAWINLKFNHETDNIDEYIQNLKN